MCLEESLDSLMDLLDGYFIHGRGILVAFAVSRSVRVLLAYLDARNHPSDFYLLYILRIRNVTIHVVVSTDNLREISTQELA